MNKIDVLNLIRKNHGKRMALPDIKSLLGAVANSRLEKQDILDLTILMKESFSGLKTSDLVRVLKPVSELEKAEMLPIASEIFMELLERNLAEISNQDAIRFLNLCGRMRLFDSEIFDMVAPRLSIQLPDDLRRVVGVCNKLNFCFRNSEYIYESPAASTISVSDFGTIGSPLLIYILRDIGSSSENHPKVSDAISQCVDCFSHCVNRLRADRDLLQQGGIISTDSVVRFIVSLARLKRSNKLPKEVTERLRISEDVSFALTTIVAYNLRNLELSKLFKLYFALTGLEVFDDFFIRRRLVPAIAQSYNSIPEPNPREILLALTMVSQLPFSNQMVVDLVGTIVRHAEAVAEIDPLFDPIRSLALKFRPS
jgi:hypothetical protein